MRSPLSAIGICDLLVMKAILMDKKSRFVAGGLIDSYIIGFDSERLVFGGNGHDNVDLGMTPIRRLVSALRQHYIKI